MIYSSHKDSSFTFSFQDYLRVPDIQKGDTTNLEKTLYPPGRLSRISIVPEEDEEEYGNYSEDEISIDVPTGSPISARTSNGSASSKHKKCDSEHSATGSLNSFSAEQDTNSYAVEDESSKNGLEKEMLSYTKEKEKHKHVATVVRKGKNDDVSDIITNSKQQGIQTSDNTDAGDDSSSEKGLDDKRSDVNKDIKRELKQKRSKEYDAKADETCQGKDLNDPRRTSVSESSEPESKSNSNSGSLASQASKTEDETGQSDDTDDSDMDDYDSEENNSNTKPESATTSQSDTDEESFADDHFEELGVDDDVFKDIMHRVANSEGKIAIEVVKVDTEELTENERSHEEDCKPSDGDYSQNNSNAAQIFKHENKRIVTPDLIPKTGVRICTDSTTHGSRHQVISTSDFEIIETTVCRNKDNDEIRETDSMKSLINRNTSDNNTNIYSSPDTPPLHGEGETKVITEQNTAETNIETKGKMDTQDSERGVSVSNILLDSKSVSFTPTIELSNDLDEESGKIQRRNQLSINTNNEPLAVKYRKSVADPSSPTGDFKDSDTEVLSNERSGGLALLQTKTIGDNSIERELSPVSDVEFDYNKRRGSYLKIKLEGRRRQRLSISDSESSKSPTELKHFENEICDGKNVVFSPEPLLDKRQKMGKVSISNYSEKTVTISPTPATPLNTVVDITDSKAALYDTTISKSEDQKSDSVKFPKSSQKAESRQIKNINSFNAELIAIYNSTSTEKIDIPDNKQNSTKPWNNMTAASKQKDEDYFEGYQLLKSCDQTHTTQSFVTDINQMIAKTRKQTTANKGESSQDFNSDSVSNNADTNNKNNSKNNGETRTLLLPNRKETGNCQIKVSEKCAIEHDRLSHNGEHEQLSLRQNGHKNNEINEPNSSIERSPSHNKQTKIKILSKTRAYENLHERKTCSASVLRNPSDMNTVHQIQTQRRSKPLSTSSADFQLKALSICNKQGKSANENLKLPVQSENGFIKQNESSTGIRSTKGITTSGNSKMSARVLRTREEETETAGYKDRGMSAQLHRTQSALTDTARLRSIRKLLKLPGDNEEKSEQNHSSDQETNLIIQEVIDGVIMNVCSLGRRKWQTTVKTHRCTRADDDGEEVLCCLFQTSSNDVDPSTFTCDVIDPVDVCPITKKHEHLISNIVRISSQVSRKFKPEEELMVNVPISHWYVEPWQELVIRQQDGNGYWKDAINQAADVVKIDDAGKVYYGVCHFLLEPCTLAVISRPRVTSVLMAKHNKDVNAVTDDRVKMYMFASDDKKCVTMQVVPVEKPLLSEFCGTAENKKACIIVASSPLIQICVSHTQPESLAFEVPYVSVSSKRPDGKSPLRTSDQGSRDGSNQSVSPYLSPVQSPRGESSPRRLSVASSIIKGDLAFHLAQLDDDDEVKVKLLGGDDNKTIDIVTGQIEEHSVTSDQSVKFSVYDKTARLIALQTKGSLEYSDVEKVTKSFVNFLVKHKVKLRISQDPRNVYSILFTAMVDHPHREENHNFKQTYKYFKTSFQKELQIYEGDIVAISFRGNVDIPDREKMIYSFHGCRGIRKHFDIQVSNPMSQRSLQTYHGALQLYTLKTPRYSGLDRSLAPCNKNGWELSAEFPLLLPKYLKSTPVIVNKAPVSLRFHEPLTVDFLRTVCSELVNEWTAFAKALGISHARVQAIKQQHRNQVSDKILMDVMINWMKTQRISQDKVTPLINALRLCNRPKLASELAHRYSAQKMSKSKTTRDKGLQKAFSVIGKSSSVIARWRQLLHHLCQSEGNNAVDVTKEIDEKYNDEVTKCQNALNHWKTTAKTPSVWALVDALRASRCDIVADTIVTMESKKKQPDAK